MANIATINGFAQGPTKEIKLLKNILLDKGVHPTTKKKITLFSTYFDSNEIKLKDISEMDTQLHFNGHCDWSLDASFNQPVEASDVNLNELAKLLPSSEIILISHEPGMEFSEFIKLKNGSLATSLYEDFKETYDQEWNKWEVTTAPSWFDKNNNALFDYITP